MLLEFEVGVLILIFAIDYALDSFPMEHILSIKKHQTDETRIERQKKNINQKGGI